jgi:hypothetical protein
LDMGKFDAARPNTGHESSQKPNSEQGVPNHLGIR